MLNWLKKILNFKWKKSNIHLIIIAIAIVMIRRGIWWILDDFLFPNNQLLSYVVWIIVGILILYIDDKRLEELWSH